VTSSAKTVIKAGRLIKENDIGMARTLLQAAIERVEDNIKLSSDVLSPILQRLKNIEIKLRENAATASKHFMAEGTDLYSRMDIIDTGGVDVHDRIFEYKVIGDIDLYKCPDIKATVQAQMRDGYRFVIFDLSDSKFIDSSAIGAFIQIVGWLRKRGGEFIVTNIVDSVRKVFTITRLENHIRFATSMDEARDIVESIISATSR
jgi:Ca-activated chloride channel family protein